MNRTQPFFASSPGKKVVMKDQDAPALPVSADDAAGAATA